MMFRISALIALAAASRVEKHDHKFGASCDQLHERFSASLTAVRETVDATDLESLSMGTRARLTMRLFGIGRTLRRAKDCEWVQNTDDEDQQEVQALIAMLLTANPCQEQAQAEMQGLDENASEEKRAQTMQNVLEILSSDTCTFTPTDGEASQEVDNDEVMDTEEQVMVGIENMVDPELSDGSSFAETNEKYAIERFIRLLVVVAIYLFLVVICTWVVVWVALFIVQYFTMLLGMIGVYSTIGFALWEQLILPPALLACGYDLFWRILNPEIHALPQHGRW
jgi:hypothetical protein